MELTFEQAKNRAESGDDVFWVCDYRFDTLDHKAIRAVSPTQARMRTYEQGARHTSFNIISSKTGRETTRSIKYWDNTAYGDHLHIFVSEKEAWECFKGQADAIMEQVAEYRRRTLDRLAGIESTLHNLLTEGFANLNKEE